MENIRRRFHWKQLTSIEQVPSVRIDKYSNSGFKSIGLHDICEYIFVLGNDVFLAKQTANYYWMQGNIG